MKEFTFPDLTGLKDAYDADGAVIIRGVLDPEFVAEIEAHIAWLMEKHPDLATEAIGHWLVADDPFWVRFISDERFLDIAEVVVGPDIALYAADYICKAPRTGRPVRWHQDANYWRLDPMEVVTFWFAVSDSGPHNGGVRFIPGSHKNGLLPHTPSMDEHGNVLKSELETSTFDIDAAAAAKLQPGDISIHHPLTIHGSKPNTSDVWRKGGSIQYMPATTKIGDDDWPCQFLFRGQPVADVNSYRDKPVFVEGRHMKFKGCETWGSQ